MLLIFGNVDDIKTLYFLKYLTENKIIYKNINSTNTDDIINIIKELQPDKIINFNINIHNFFMIEMIYIYIPYYYLNDINTIMLTDHDNLIIDFIQKHTIVSKEKGGGFYCIASIKLDHIISYFNFFKQMPLYFNNVNYYHDYYKTPDLFNKDITNIFYNDITNDNIIFRNPVQFNTNIQFSNYKNIDFVGITPFIEKYFSYSDNVKEHAKFLVNKYNIDYLNTCSIMFRGTNKSQETIVPSYDIFVDKAKQIKKENPKIKFLVQTDEQEFIDIFVSNFPDAVYFDEIPRMNHDPNGCIMTTIPDNNKIKALIFYISSTYIMSKTKYIIHTTDNGSLWIILNRGNTINTFQYLQHKEYVYGNKNHLYNPTQTNFFINDI